MKICGCYIVKNEGERLRKSLESIRGSVDDILVVDTGSEDATIAVAESCGARILHYDWQEDFSAARNYALDHLQGDWVVFLDGDEYFSSETAGNLRRTIEKAKTVEADVLLVPWDNIEETTGERLLLSYAPRIFRLDHELRYEGRIHEMLRRNGKPVEEVLVVDAAELCLMHTGYSSQVAPEKARRNLAMLQRELRETKYPEDLYMYLAECYDGLGERELAKKYARMDAAQGRRKVLFASRSWRILLRLLSEEPANFRERQGFAAKAAAAFSELPEFHAEYAETLAYQLDFPAACREAEQAAMCLQNYHGMEPLMFDQEMLSQLQARAKNWQSMEARAASLRISACVIVKNEEKNLPGWLENAVQYGDERIVVDTGSEDATLSLAKEAGCRCTSVLWQEDFSAARNAALAMATGDWIAMLDADETFFSPERLHGFLAEVEFYHPEAQAVELMIHNVDEDEGGLEIQRFSAVRLFRNLVGMAYGGKVHETLYMKGSLPVVYVEPYRFAIHHTGYSSRRMRDKAIRNLHILEQEIAAEGLGERHYRALADCYASLGDFSAGLHFARLAMEAGVQARGSRSDMYYLALLCMEETGASWADRLNMAQRGRQMFPELPDFYGAEGLLLRLTSPEQAEKLLLRAEASAGIPSGQGRQEATHYANMRGEVQCALASLYRQRGEERMAAEELERVLRGNCYDRDALEEYYELHREMSKEELANRLTRLFPSEQEGEAYLSRWAEQLGDVELWQILRKRHAGEHEHTVATRQELYREAVEGNPATVYGKIAKRVAQEVYVLLVLLLRMEQAGEFPGGSLGQRCLRQLPEDIRYLWEAYLGQTQEFSQDDYRMMLPTVLSQGTDEQAVQFALLGAKFSWGVPLQATRILMQAERWQAAFAIFQQVPAGAPEVDGMFWHDVGVCLYHMGESDASAECLDRAEEMGCQALDIAAYRQWMEEAGHEAQA